MGRIYNRVGEIVDAEQLNQLNHERILRFNNIDDASQHIIDNPRSEGYAGSMCIIIDEQRLYGYIEAADGTQAWQPLEQPSRSRADIVPKSKRIPHLPNRWENPRIFNVAESLEAQANNQNFNSYKIIEEDAEIVEEEVFYAVEQTGKYIAQADTDLEFVLIGGGGSGSGIGFQDEYENSGVQYAYNPWAGSPGAAGSVQQHRIRVHAGDEIEIIVGTGGLVEDISEVQQISRIAKSRAGNDTIVLLNGEEVARAYGGCGGIDPEIFTIQTGMLADNDRHDAYNLPQAGGGILSPVGESWGLGPTPQYPEGWKQPNLLPPYGTKVRAGAGFRITEEIVESTKVGVRASSDGNWIMQGGGSEGISLTSQLDTQDGVYETFTGSGASALSSTYPRTKTAGAVISWGNDTIIVGQSGARSVIVGSSDELSATDLSGATVIAENSFGYGGDAGAGWQKAFNTVSSLDDSYNIAVAENGGNGACLIKHSVPANTLAATQSVYSYKPKRFHNSRPEPPTLTFDTPLGETSPGRNIRFTVTHNDLDAGDPISYWQMRRRIMLPDGSVETYLLRQTPFGIWTYEHASSQSTIITRKAFGEQQWLDTADPLDLTAEDQYDGAGINRRLVFDIRSVPQQSTGGITTSYRLAPVWAPYEGTVAFDVRSADSAGNVSDWSEGEYFTLLPNQIPDRPTFTSVPPGTNNPLTNLRLIQAVNFNFDFSDFENDEFVGFKLFKYAVSIDDNTSGRLSLFSSFWGNFQWLRPSTDEPDADFFYPTNNVREPVEGFIDGHPSDQDIIGFDDGGIVWDVPLEGDGIERNTNWTRADTPSIRLLTDPQTSGNPNFVSDPWWANEYLGTGKAQDLGQRQLIRFFMVNIANTDPSGGEIDVANLQQSLTSNGLIFDDGVRSIEVTPEITEFNVFETDGPAQVQVFNVLTPGSTVTPVTPMLQTNPTVGSWTVVLEPIGAEGTRTYALRVTPPDHYNGGNNGNQGVNITVTFTAPGFIQYQRHLVAFHNPPDEEDEPDVEELAFSGLPSSYNLQVGSPQDFAFSLNENPDTVNFISEDTDICAITVIGTGASRTLRLTPQAEGSTVVRLSAIKSGFLDAHYAAPVAVGQGTVVQSLQFSGLPSSYSLNLGSAQTYNFNISSEPNTLDFSSNNTNVCAIAITGTGTSRTLTLTPQAIGSTTINISATRVGFTPVNYTAQVSVSAATAIPTLSISGLSSTYSLTVGQNRTIPFYVSQTPDSTTATSTNSSVATASISTAISGQRSLLINPLSAGTATIQVSATRSGYNSATRTITVTVAESTSGLTLSFSGLSSTYIFSAGETLDVPFTVSATPDTINASSSDTRIGASILGSGTSRTLRLQGIISDVSATITITASREGYIAAQRFINVSTTAASNELTITGLPERITLDPPLSSTSFTGTTNLNFQVTPEPDSVIYVGSPIEGIALVSLSGSGTQYTLSISAVGTGEGQIFVAAEKTGFEPAGWAVLVDVLPAFDEQAGAELFRLATNMPFLPTNNIFYIRETDDAHIADVTIEGYWETDDSVQVSVFNYIDFGYEQTPYIVYTGPKSFSLRFLAAVGTPEEEALLTFGRAITIQSDDGITVNSYELQIFFE